LIFAVHKAVEKLAHKEAGTEDIHKLVRQPLTEKIERVVVKTGIKIRVIPVEKINYLEAQDDYVMIYTDEGKHLKQATMSFFEENLDSNAFIRVHRSYIVRIDQVMQLEPYGKDTYVAKLKNGVTLKVSKSGLKNLKQKLHF
jgi:two-component system LytT family response regulator